MNKQLRIGLLVIAAALALGVVWGGATTGDRGMTFLGLVAVVLIFERIIDVWS